MPTNRDTLGSPSPFSSGPYTTALSDPPPDAPEASQGLSRGHKWTLIITVAIIFALGCWAGAAMQPKDPRTETRSSLANCKTEDGHTQESCIWEDGTGYTIINLDYGRYSYNINTAVLTDTQEGY